MMASQLLQPPRMPSSSAFSVVSKTCPSLHTLSFSFLKNQQRSILYQNGRRRSTCVVGVSNKEDTDTEVSSSSSSTSTSIIQENYEDPTPEELEYVSQIKQILERLKSNRDMNFNEVKLTIMIEDPRDVERRRLLGIDDENAPTRDDLADALEEVNEGKIPENRLALQMLAEEMMSWPNLEEEAPKKIKPGKSLYAKATDTGVDPKEAAKRLKMDWDTAAEIEDVDENDNVEVPSVVVCSASLNISDCV